MPAVPTLTDRIRLAAQRRRAASSDLADFIHQAAISEIEERLKEVNRTFTDAKVVTGFPQVWGSALPQARVIADEETLDLAVGSADLVVHGMALHWSNDPVGQLVQARRALRPDGLFLGVMFAGQTLYELRTALAVAEVEVLGGLSPRIAPMAEIRDLGALLQRSGFALPVADSVPLTVTYADAMSLMRDLRAMGEGNALSDRLRKPVPPRLFRRAAEVYHAHNSGPDGRIFATFELVFLTGWAPDDSQQKPLRPGSAITRLADALGTAERPTDDTVSKP